MDENRRIRYTITADDQMSRVTQRIAKEYNDMRDSMVARDRKSQLEAQVLEDLGLSKKKKAGAFDSLKSATGEESDLGMFGKMLAGGGALAGLSMVGTRLNNATMEALKLRDEFSKGNMTVGEMADKLAGIVPIYGQLWQAGRNYRELLTGELADLQEVEALERRRLEVLQQRGSVLRDVIARGRQNEASARSAADRMREADADERDRPLVRLSNAYNEGSRKSDEFWKFKIGQASIADRARLEREQEKERLQRLTEFSQDWGVLSRERTEKDLRDRRQYSIDEAAKEQARIDRAEQELRQRRIISTEIADKEQRHLDGVEADLRSRRATGLQIADYQESIRQKTIAGEEGARRTGIASAVQAGLSRGVGDRSGDNPMLREAQKQTKAVEKNNELVEKLITALTTGNASSVFTN